MLQKLFQVRHSLSNKKIVKYLNSKYIPIESMTFLSTNLHLQQSNQLLHVRFVLIFLNFVQWVTFYLN